jgi:hypothetical protein
VELKVRSQTEGKSTVIPALFNPSLPQAQSCHVL